MLYRTLLLTALLGCLAMPSHAEEKAKLLFDFVGRKPDLGIGTEVMATEPVGVGALVVFELAGPKSYHIRLARPSEKSNKKYAVYKVQLDGSTKQLKFVEQP